jgi:hypothetical protein
MHSELVIADSSEAESVADSDGPSNSWAGFAYSGLDRIKLITLWALLESGVPDDRFDARLDAIRVVPDRETGPWVDVLPAVMVTALSRIASLNADTSESLVEKWNGTDEFEGWDSAEVSDLLHGIGDAAESAVLEGKTLLLGTSH